MNVGHKELAVLRASATERPPDDQAALQNLQLLAWSSHYRSTRGEFLHSQQCLEAAIDAFLCLLQRYGDGPYRGIHTRIPRLRLEELAPSLARELLAIALGVVDMRELQLLEIAHRELRPRMSHLSWNDYSALCARIRHG